MTDRFCQCGCGKKLIRRGDEDLGDFRIRKYASRECVVRARTGKPGKTNNNHVGSNRKDTAVFHPAIDKFLYAKPRPDWT